MENIITETMKMLAINFANWINKNDYEKIHGDRWCKKFMSYTHSTEELYELFLADERERLKI